MSPEWIGIVGVCVLMLLMFSGMWLGFAMALVGFLGLIFISGFDGAVKVLGTNPYTTMAFYPISSLPFFVVMGIIVGAAGLSTDLYATAHKWFGRLPGGLAISTTFACGGFAAITGSSSASVLTMGSVALPEMKKYNYDHGLATGTIAAGGTIGILIPPSLGFILYAILTEQSIGRLFMAGILPGIFQVLAYAAIILIMCYRNPALGPRGPRSTMKEKIQSLKYTWPVLFLFLLVIGGMYAGTFTPTEAASIGAGGSILIVLVMRRLTVKGVFENIVASFRMVGMLFVLIMGAFIFAHFIALSRLPHALSDFVTGLHVSKYLILLFIVIIYIILGMFTEINSSIVLTIPVLYPVVMSLGFDPIWFGVIVVKLMEIGLVTPPIGMNVFLLGGTSDVPLSTIFRGVFPFVISDFVQLAILIAVPQISLFLPQSMF